MTTFGELSKGDRIVMGGADFEVVKAKLKGKAVKLTVTGKRGTFSSEVKAKATIELAPKPGKVALDGPKGEQQRWATEKEARQADDWADDSSMSKAETLARFRALSPEPSAIGHRTSPPPGDPAQTKRPAKADGGPWETRRDKAEEVLATIGAHLVGEATDESAGYYVPPIDVETVAAHLLIFHGVDGTAYASAADALTLHAQHHDDAKTGGILQTVHWHSKQRP